MHVFHSVAVKLPPFEYVAVETVDEAVSLLGEHGDDAKVMAGGQSLVPLLALRLARPAVLVDVNRVAELDGINGGDGLRVGALTRHRVAERSAVILAEQPLVPEALRFVGHAAIRNRGTIGGTIAHADPAAELPAVLLALDGGVEVRSARSARTIAAADLFEGFLSTTLEPDELLTEVWFPRRREGAGWSFKEFSRRSGDFAIVGVAAALQVGDDGRIGDARLAFTGVGSTPVRADVGDGILGQVAAPPVYAEVARAAAAQLEPTSDLHGTATFRRHLAAVLAERALLEAHQRAVTGA
jgi:CO/xanthine dehydrogenase FAD-binding subunit